MASHLHVDSVPFGWRNIRVCGQPWHGVIWRDLPANGNQVWMRLENGLLKSQADFPWLAAVGGAFENETQLVAVPGMPTPPALQATQQAQGLKFYPDAIFFGRDKFYSPEAGLQLGASSWLYVDGNAAVWRMGVIQGLSQRISTTQSLVTLVVVCHGRFGLVDGTTQAPGFRVVGSVPITYTHSAVNQDWSASFGAFVSQSKTGRRAAVMLGYLDPGITLSDPFFANGVAELVLSGDGSGDKGVGISVAGSLAAAQSQTVFYEATTAPLPLAYRFAWQEVSGWSGVKTGVTRSLPPTFQLEEQWLVTLNMFNVFDPPADYDATWRRFNERVLSACYANDESLQVFVERNTEDGVRSVTGSVSGGTQRTAIYWALPGQQPSVFTGNPGENYPFGDPVDPLVISVTAESSAVQRKDLLRNSLVLERGSLTTDILDVSGSPTVTTVSANNRGSVTRWGHNVFGWTLPPAGYEAAPEPLPQYQPVRAHGPDVSMALGGYPAGDFFARSVVYNPRTQSLVVVSGNGDGVLGALVL